MNRNFYLLFICENKKMIIIKLLLSLNMHAYIINILRLYPLSIHKAKLAFIFKIFLFRCPAVKLNYFKNKIALMWSGFWLET